MTKKQRGQKVIEILNREYGTDCKCFLNHESPFQLLVATILSAQCTDERVNKVTVDLFKKYPDVFSFANAKINELEEYIFSTGFYKNKAKNIIEAAKKTLKQKQIT